MRYTSLLLPVLLCLLQVSSNARTDTGCPPGVSAREYVQQLEQRIEGDDIEAALQLAKAYQLGQCMKRDHAKAREIYELLAQDGIAEAEFRLALIHLNGLGVPENKIIAEMWLNRAITHHHPTALEFLEYMHEVGFDDC